MKFLLRCLPTVALIAAAVLLWSSASHKQVHSAEDQQAERQAIQEQMKQLSQRLEELGSDSHHALPRGGLNIL